MNRILITYSCFNPSTTLLESIQSVYDYLDVSSFSSYKIVCIDNDSSITTTYDKVEEKYPEVEIIYAKNKNYEWGAYKYSYENYSNYDTYVCLQDTVIFRKPFKLSLNDDSVYMIYHNGGFQLLGRPELGTLEDIRDHRLLKNINLDIDTFLHEDFNIAQHNSFIITKNGIEKLYNTLINPAINKIDAELYERLFGLYFIQTHKTINLLPFIEKINRDKRSYTMKLIENDSDPKNDWGTITSNRFKVKSKTNPRVWIEDNFYEDPDKVREYALGQMYWDKGHGGVGWRTRKQYIFDGVKEKFETIMNKKISNWTETYEICGVFQAGFGTLDGIPPQVFHCDSQQWAAMIFLTPDAPPQTGTKIVRNKKSKIYHTTQSDNVNDYFPNQGTFCDSTLYEDVDVIGNVYNRLVIFDGQCIHSSSGYFGSSFETGRLWQMFFFDTKEK